MPTTKKHLPPPTPDRSFLIGAPGHVTGGKRSSDEEELGRLFTS